MAKKQEFSIETVKKYYFWVVVPVGLLTAIFVTLGAVGKITAEFNARKSTLESTKKTVEGIRGDRAHPNQGTIDDIKGKTKELEGRVFAAWDILLKDQRERNLWPQEVGELFFNEIHTLKFGSQISVQAREDYLNFINRYLPYLETHVDRRRLQRKNTTNGLWEEIPRDTHGRLTSSPDLPSGGGADAGILAEEATLPRGPNGEELFRYVGVVDWNTPETRTVTSHWVTLPRSVEIWYAQEELWVYFALLSVIKETNAGATGRHNAAIKRIENLSIGKLASQSLAERSATRIRAGIGGMDSLEGVGSLMSAGADSGMGAGAEMMGAVIKPQTEADAETFIRNYRYVDDKAQPLAASAASPFNEFKRMPVLLRLIVDQRKIPEILVNCANCAMPIEVLWVRINPGATRPFEIDSYVSGNTLGGGGGDPQAGMVSAPGGGMGMRPGDASGGGEGPTIHLGGALGHYGTESVPIEIYGCISIFNSVEDSDIRKETAQAQ